MLRDRAYKGEEHVETLSCARDILAANAAETLRGRYA